MAGVAAAVIPGATGHDWHDVEANWVGTIVSIPFVGLGSERFIGERVTERFVSLMATKKQNLAILTAVVVVAGFAGLMAGIKRNSANHILILFADVMLALMVGTLPVGRELARVNRLSAETGKQQQMTQKYAGLFALVVMVCAATLLAVEYTLL